MRPDLEMTSAGPRRYRIWVEGRLRPGFTHDLEGAEQEDIDGITTLTGRFVDASQIYGLLDRLRQLGIGVVRLETDDRSKKPQDRTH